MENRSCLKGIGKTPIMNSEPASVILIGSDKLQMSEELKEINSQSTISIIVTRLIKNSKNGEMLERLKDKLCLTKEEISKIIFEL